MATRMGHGVRYYQAIERIGQPARVGFDVHFKEVAGRIAPMINDTGGVKSLRQDS